MALAPAFPSLVVSSRVYTAGAYPNTTLQALGGTSAQVRHSNEFSGDRLLVTFSAVDAVAVEQIRLHYLRAQGQFATFVLPEILWSGSSDPTLGRPIWRYVQAPVIVDVGCGNHNITVELETVPYLGITLLPNSWLFWVQPDEIVDTEFEFVHPTFGQTGTGLGAPARKSFFNAWELSDQRFDLVSFILFPSSTNVVPTYVTYSPSGGPVFDGVEEDCVFFADDTVVATNIERTIYLGDPFYSDKQQFLLNKQLFEGITYETDVFFSNIPDSVRKTIECYLEFSVDGDYAAFMYWYLEQDSFGLFAQYSDFGESPFVYLEDETFLTNDTWHRVSLSVDIVNNALYMHVDGVLILQGTPNLNPGFGGFTAQDLNQLLRFEIDYLPGSRTPGSDIRYGKTRITESAVFGPQNYTPKSLLVNPLD